MKLKVLSMDWMLKFQCIGGTCPQTCCCTNWNIKLSDSEIEKYENMEHPFRENILKAIDKDKKSMKGKNGKCQMLTEDGWCQIVQHCGGEYLSQTCQHFPRERKQYGDVLEQTVGIACPVVSGYLFEQQEIEFCFDEIDAPEEVQQDINYEVYDGLSISRTYLIELLQSYENNFCTGKLYVVLSTLYKIRELITQKQLNKTDIIQSLEYYEDEEVRRIVFQKGEEIAENYRAKSAVIQKLLIQVYSVVEMLKNKGFFYDKNMYEDIQIWMHDTDELMKYLEGFSKYFRENYQCLYTNYFVYQIFGDWIEMDETKFGDVFICKITEFTLIQLWAMSVWKRNGVVERQEYEKIVAGCDRALSHNGDFIKNMNGYLQQNGMNNSASLLLLLIV